MKRIVKVVESYLGRFLLWIACVLLVALVYANETERASDWSADDWQALGAVVTAAIALLAVAVAVGQLRDARELRWEQAAPYVVAYLESDPTTPKLAYLRVKNFGGTVAYDVRLDIEPVPMRSSKVGGGEVVLPPQMPTLVPGQEWNTFWDFTPARYKERSVLVQLHTVRVTYRDSRNQVHVIDSVIDWDSFISGRRWIDRKSIHHVAERLGKIEVALERIEDKMP